MNLTKDQIETALESAKEARESIDHLLQMIGEEYPQVEVLNETIDELLDSLEEDLSSTDEDE